MEISDLKSHCLIKPNIQTITNKTVQEIMRIINRKKKPVVIDLAGVENCVNNFFNLIKSYEGITLLNIESSLLSMLYITGFDKYVTVYGEIVSYEDKSRALVNRRLSLV